jgi:hypothetical protein
MTAEPKIMPLQRALYVLASVHTRDDELTGFVVERIPSAESFFSPSDYVEASAAVRKAVQPAKDAACNICGGRTHMGCCNPNATMPVDPEPGVRPICSPVGSSAVQRCSQCAACLEEIALAEQAARAEIVEIPEQNCN